MTNLFLNVLNKKFFNQVFRYIFVGVGYNSIGYLLYLLITYIGVAPKITVSILYPMGAMLNFFINKSLTFNCQTSISTVGLKYCIAQMLGYFINLVILVLMVDKLGYSDRYVQGVAIFIVAGFLFSMSKWFVFREETRILKE